MLEFFQNPLVVLGLIVLFAVLVVFVAVVLLPFFRKIGFNVGGAIDATAGTLVGLDVVVEALKVVFPNNSAVNMADKIILYAQKGVEQAEQLYKMDKLAEDDRKAAAFEFVIESLNVSGFMVTPEIEKVIDGSIEAAVLALPHLKEFIKDNGAE